MLSEYTNQKRIYVGKQSKDMLSVRGVNTSVIRPDDFLCVWMSGSYSQGGDRGLALDISLWQSTSHKDARAGGVHTWASRQPTAPRFPSQENSTAVATVVCPWRFWAVQM